MTLTYLEVDTVRKEVEMIRAGHCPAFFYEAEKDEVTSLREGTLGLGIVRNGTFSTFMGSPQKIQYKPGDFMVLYTDGIVEARNPKGEEYGYERFEMIIDANKHNPPQKLAEKLVESVKTFAEQKVQDDFTVLIVKFLEPKTNQIKTKV
jgi:serine phosphatase RsbU (regulator of sigma subunit)